MSNDQGSRQLLLALIAYQNGFISRSALIDSWRRWTADRTQAFEAILQSCGSLTPAHAGLLAALLRVHLDQHQGDPQQSLAALSSLGSFRDELAQLLTPELRGILAEAGALTKAKDETLIVDRSLLQQAAAHSGDAGERPRFRILRLHAKGGLGQVSIAVDDELQRQVAFKEMQPQFADQPDSRDRFVREALITGGLEHPNIVPVYGLGTYADGRPFYAMRFIQGDSLKEAITSFHAEQHVSHSDRVLGLRKLLGRLVDVCNAMAYSHSRGVLHRDLKPGNIMLGRYGETLVVDWGLARSVGEAAEAATEGVPAQLGSGLEVTLPGSSIGTPAYMSPEQAAGRIAELGPPSDVYSLGATLYHLLTGRPPFHGPALKVIELVQKGEFVPPRNIVAATPPALNAICLKAMALDPAGRYETPRAMADDIERWLADEPVSACRDPLATRLLRWGRKHRALVTTSAALLVAGTIALAIGNSMLRGANLRIAAERDRAEGRLYANQIAAAQREWEVNNANGARQSLADTREDLRGWEYRLLSSRFDRGQSTFRGHKSGVQSVCISPDGTRVISGDDDGAIRIWRLGGDESQVATISLDVGILGVAVHPDGTKVAACTGDGRIAIADAKSGKQLRVWKVTTAVAACVAFSPDGKILASGDGEGVLKLWDWTDGKERLAMQGTITGIRSVSFRPDGRQIATGDTYGKVSVWDTQTGKEVWSRPGHSSSINSVSFDHDGKRLLSGSWDGLIKLWEATGGRELLTVDGRSSGVAGVAFSPDGARFVGAYVLGSFKVWDTASGREISTTKGHLDEITSICYSADGRSIVTASADKTVKVWDSGLEDQDVITLRGPMLGVTSISWSPDGKRIAAGNVDDKLRVWNAIDGRPVFSVPAHQHGVDSVLFSPDGHSIVTGSRDHSLAIWDASTGKRRHAFETQITRTLFASQFPRAAFGVDGKLLVTAGFEEAITLWDVGSPRPLKEFQEGAKAVNAILLTPDGNQIVGGCGDSAVRIWKLADGRIAQTLRGHAESVECVAVTTDGRRLASGGEDRQVIIWDLSNGRKPLTLKGHSSGVTGLSFSPDGRRLASSSADRSIKLWDTASGQETLTLKGHTSDIRGVSFSPDGSRLASGSLDGTIKVWCAEPVKEGVPQ